jgi:AraC-like DNA-binding protein
MPLHFWSRFPLAQNEKQPTLHQIDTDEIYHLHTRKALAEHFFNHRENGFCHASFEREFAFYESVCSGNVETVKTLFTPLGGEGFGTLSKDPLQNLKYHLVITIAMITRFCVNAGMPLEEAYSMSDVYIQQTDCCKSESEIRTLHDRMTIEFTKRMRQINNGHPYSKLVTRILDYISDHLHEKIMVQEIAEAVSFTVPYISRVFRKEVGVTITDYVTQKKVEAAANMLQFSDYTALEISNYLQFSSQSYFIKKFKKYIGITPKEYYRRYHTVSWMPEK